MNETSTTLDRVWDDLEQGFRHDLRRARNRRRVPFVASAAAVLTLGSAATIAAATDLWSGSPAPPPVKQELFGVNSADAIEVAHDGPHILYAAKKSDGTYCMTDDKQTGTWCTDDGSSASISYRIGGGTDRRWRGTPGYEYKGGVVYGRVTVPGAITVDIKLPGGAATAHASIGTNGFFITGLPAAAWWANQDDEAPIGPATALDASGEIVATSPALPVHFAADGSDGQTPNTLANPCTIPGIQCVPEPARTP